MSFTVGSLFDGSGGFPLSAFMCGGVPVWASEIEPYPIAVTKSRFPYMKHLGSVTDIKGGEVDPVDVITFGSPCQDLSVAGKRAGLKHTENGDDETTRSGLFMEAVRIIKEMREATGGKYPRFAIWENVPGAFSSNKGEDFRVVLEELIKTVEPGAVMPAVPKNGWPYADSYCGDGWSIAYRVLDSQYAGVPQRRRRIYLVLDLGGECAGKVLFERQGLRGYFTEGRTPWQGTAGDAADCAGTADCEGVGLGYSDMILDDQGGSQISVRDDGKCPTLRAEMHGNIPAVMEPMAFDDYNFQPTGDQTCTLRAGASGGACGVTVCYDARGNGDGSIAPTITGDHNNRVTDYTAVVCCIDGDKIGKAERAGGSGLGIREGDKMYTLTAKDAGTHAVCVPIQDQATRFSGKRGDNYDGKGNGLGVGNPDEPMFTLTGGDRHAVCFWDGSQTASTLTANNANDAQRMPDKENFNCVIEQVPAYGVDCRNATEYPESMGAIQAAMNHNLNSNGIVRVQYIVRRLTPTECARLQGFPDKWGHPDKKTEFTDEEYEFWLNVRNTHAVINGKATKDYTRDQMLTWYNKLHTDSSEYKMWGNGIALPCALYVMQGIGDVLN